MSRHPDDERNLAPAPRRAPWPSLQGGVGPRGDDTLQQSSSDSPSELEAPSAHLFEIAASGHGACHSVSGDGLLIGRAGGSPRLSVAFDDPRMSREHAQLVATPGGWWLVDLGSRNGSVVNGLRVEPKARAPLPSGAVLRMGDTVLVFREGPAPSEPAPPSQLASFIGDAERGAFPGISACAHVIRRRIARLSERSGHVLILGETGTGKERVARAMTPHRDIPPVVQNCAELTRELARSELFGHLRGAFTGAHANRAGLVEMAGEGVLFLDELGELPYEVQGEALRFLEDGMYRPVGAMELRRSRARVVAATNVDLDEAVRRGGFRRDLLARLRASNQQLELPPLRARREDILGWARAFAVELTGQEPAQRFTASALECLLLYPWPENLRELRGVIRELCDAHPDGVIRAEDLPERVRAGRDELRSASHAVAGAEPPLRFGGGGPPVSPPPRPEPSAEEIIRVLEERKGNVRGSAEQLAMERTKLYRRCRSLGIDPESFRVP